MLGGWYDGVQLVVYAEKGCGQQKELGYHGAVSRGQLVVFVDDERREGEDDGRNEGSDGDAFFC